MLNHLSVRNVVLIEKLDLAFERGLCALTGETGAGKSILLDSLGLALGNRAESRLLRPGSDQASVTASFSVPAGHPAQQILEAHDLEHEEDFLMLRRVVGADGRSRAFVNDQPVSAGLLRKLGDCLIEIQGQFEQRGLLDAGTHRHLLDQFGGHEDLAAEVAGRWGQWQAARRSHEEALALQDQARREEAFLRHAYGELSDLNPQSGELETLGEQRSLLMNRDRILETMNSALVALAGNDATGSAEQSLGAARRLLGSISEKSGARIACILESLDRADAELNDAVSGLQDFAGEMEAGGENLAEVEERYFALQDLARKHGVAPDTLPALRAEMAAKLASIEDGGTSLERLEKAAAEARGGYCRTAARLSKARTAAAKNLDTAVNRELAPLKLEKAAFATSVAALEEAAWSASGQDRISFQVSTNPGAPPGPLGKIASGGELSRFLLALKVVMAGVGRDQTLVFDEVDSGIGGATAHAVGERLARLAETRQVLVVTHSPQVAARAQHHWQVQKQTAKKGSATRVAALNAQTRREEIARMISGAQVTEEARAAAERLLGAA